MKKLFPTNKLRAGLTSLAKCAVLCAAMISGELSAQFYFHKWYDVPNNPLVSCDLRIHERTKAVVQDISTNDYYYVGGYLTAGGESQCTSYPQGTIIKTNQKGEPQWEKKVSDNGYFTDVKCLYGQMYQEFTGLIIAGGTNETHSPVSFTKFQLLKTDANGNLIKHKEYSDIPGTCNKVIRVFDMQGHADGFVGVGTLQYENEKRIYIVKVDENLDVIEAKEYYQEGLDCEGYSIIQDDNDGFVLTGSYGLFTWVIKVDNNLAYLDDTQLYHNGNGGGMVGKDILRFNTGLGGSIKRYAVLTNNTIYRGDLNIIHLDQNLNSLLSVEIDLQGFAIANGFTRSASGYAISGSLSNSSGLSQTPILVKINLGFTGTTFAKAYTEGLLNSAVWPTTDAGFIMGGEYAQLNGFYFVKTNASGEISESCQLETLNPYLNTFYPSYNQDPFSENDQHSPVELDEISDIDLDEIFICGDMCSDVTTEHTEGLEYVCDSIDSITLVADCPPGTVSQEWKMEVGPGGEYTIGVGPQVSFPPIDLNYFTYNVILYCYDKHGCAIRRKVYHFEEVIPNFDWGTPVIGCVGEEVTLGLEYQCPPNTFPVWPNGGPVITVVGNGTYYLYCLNEQGCPVEIRSFYVQTCAPNPGDGNSNSAETTRNISLYPNPTTGVVKVDVPVQGDETYSLRVVDMIGKELITKVNLNESSYSLDISALPAGVYQVEVQVGGELIRKKLIKQ